MTKLWPSRTASVLPAAAIDCESSGIIVTSTTSLAATSSIVTPRPALICAPTSTTSSVASDFAESAPAWCASSRSFLIFLSSSDMCVFLDPEAGPAGDGIGGADEVHAGIRELLERAFGLRREGGREAALAVGHGHGRHAVGHQVDLLRERRILRRDLAEQI